MATTAYHRFTTIRTCVGLGDYEIDESNKYSLLYCSMRRTLEPLGLSHIQGSKCSFPRLSYCAGRIFENDDRKAKPSIPIRRSTSSRQGYPPSVSPFARI